MGGYDTAVLCFYFTNSGNSSSKKKMLSYILCLSFSVGSYGDCLHDMQAEILYVIL